MKKITFLIPALLLSFAINAQNLINYWNGYNPATSTYVTGVGSEAMYWGWSTNPATAVGNWSQANVASAIRYMDNVSGYDAGRIMYIRWDGVLSTAGKYYLKLDSINVAQLTGGHAYTFTWSYAWNSNASAPNITTTICSAKDGSGVISALAITGTNAVISGTSEIFPCNATSKLMQTGSVTFIPPVDGDYYISFGADKAALCAIRDLSLFDYGDKYAGLIELQSQADALTLGNISAVTSNLTLPTTAGTQGVTVKWKSNNPSIIDSLGNVVRPAKYNQTVILTATLSLNFADTIYTRTKTFAAIVMGIIPTPDQIAEWNFAGDLISESNGTFTVKDKQSGFVGTIMNEARIRTIGTSTQYNVLDLGNGTGYFDMGTEIGKAIYSLNNYTICGYFRIAEDYTELNSNGNFYWTFSNTAAAATDQTGYIIGSLKAQSQSISSKYYAVGNQAVGPGTNAPIGGWHHFAYTQNGTTGTIFVDGVQLSTGTVTNLPSTTLTRDGLTGTLYNWLGRSNYVSDVYLRKTLLWDFQLMSIPLTSDDINFGLEVPATIGKLDVAYNENSDYVLPELTTEKDNLTLPDLSAVISDITLPTQGLNTTVNISWKSTNNNLIDSTGKVTRPNYFSYPDTLTATLSKNGQKLFKSFPAVVVVKDGTSYTNNLLVKYDFSSVTDSVVTDVAEKHLTGVLKNDASIRSIGSTVKYNVLSLGDSIGYFDMGTEVGKLMYNLNDFTVSAYFRIDSSYNNLKNNGNFLWNFSNTKNALSIASGYMIFSLRNQAETISSSNWTTEQTIAVADSAFKASWHNITYTQSANTGTLYVDGMPLLSDTITSLPSNTLKKAGQLGTLFNWIGRSCYAGDAYLRKTLVYDFRLYSTALTDAQIQNSVLNVGATINALDAAYEEQAPNALKPISTSKFRVLSSVGNIKITGLAGNENVSLYDITGRKLKVNNPSMIPVNTGIYIVRINNYVTKIIVR